MKFPGTMVAWRVRVIKEDPGTGWARRLGFLMSPH